MANMAGDPLPPRSFMLIGVPFETALGETRVAVTSESAKKRIAQGHVIRVQSGAGVAASVTDAGYQTAGAEITDQAEAFGADVVLNPGGLQGQDVDHEQALDGRGLRGPGQRAVLHGQDHDGLRRCQEGGRGHGQGDRVGGRVVRDEALTYRNYVKDWI